MTSEQASCPIEIVWENYAKYPATAIVNSSNDYLVLGSNVSTVVLDAAGPLLPGALADVAAREGVPLPLGTAVYTKAFNAGNPGTTKFIIHVALLGSRKESPAEGRILATVESAFLSSANAVALADQLGCETIVFPVMAARAGYSVLECSPENVRWAMATSMVIGIKRALRQTKNLRRVFISAWNSQSKYQDDDVQMLRCLIRENSALHVRFASCCDGRVG